MKTIAVINQEGGVGKTTTAVNLGHALARRGNRVMLADLDPQGQLAPCLGLFRSPAEGLDSVLLDGDSLASRSVATRELLQLVPAGKRLGDFERAEGGVERARVLRDGLAANPPDVDYLMFDCPSSAGLLVVNAMLAADEVLVPVAGDSQSLTELARLMCTIKKVEGLRTVALRKSIFLSRFMARRRLSCEVSDKLLQHFPRHLLPTRIGEAAALAECASAGRTIFEYRGKSRSAKDFDSLAEDLLRSRVTNDEQKAACDVA